MNETSKPLTSTEDLRNNGILMLREPDQDSVGTRTPIIVGLGRSGTTMAAKVLDAIGVDMGRPAKSAVMEDVEIGNAVHAGDRKQLATLIERKNAAFSSWGFKRPRVFSTISKSIDLFRNPVVIAPVRDPLAIALRNSISVGADPTDELIRQSKLSRVLLDALFELDVPVMLFSYEKALTKPTDFVLAIAQFAGVENVNVIAGVNAIRADDTNYLENTVSSDHHSVHKSK